MQDLLMPQPRSYSPAVLAYIYYTVEDLGLEDTAIHHVVLVSILMACATNE